MNEQTPVALSALEDALLFLGAGNGFGTAAAWVNRETGAVLWYCAEVDEFGPLPVDIDDAERYVPIPDTRDFELGKPLALRFTRGHLPACYEQVCEIFSRRGAYARFKDFLDRHDSLDAWHEWEAEQTREALREWCAENGITLAD